MKTLAISIATAILIVVTLVASARTTAVQPIITPDITYNPVEFQPSLLELLLSDRRETKQETKKTEVVLDAETKKQLDCLAINIYREAAVEPVDGRIAVGQVTMNRVEHPDFPNTVCEVVYEKTRNRNTGRTICQFSWYCDPAHRNRAIHQPTYDESYEIARQVLIDGVRLPNLEDALFYHAAYVNPRWRLDRIERIGLHIFYRPRTQTELALVKH